MMQPSLRDCLNQSGRFRTMTVLLDEVGLGAALDRPGYGVMLLAVQDPIFARLRSGVLAHLRQDRARLGAMLGRHVIRGSIIVGNDSFARGSSPTIATGRQVNLQLPLRVSWMIDSPEPHATAALGEAFQVQTFGGPLEVRVRPGAVTAGDVEVLVPSHKAGLWYEVDHLLGRGQSSLAALVCPK